MKSALSIIIRVFCTLGMFVSLFVLAGCCSDQTIDSLKGGNLIGVLPFDNRCSGVYFSPDLRFKVDIGANSSSISRRDLLWLISNGYTVDSTSCVATGRNSRGEMFLSMKRYKVDLPVWGWQVADSLPDRSLPGSHRLVPKDRIPDNVLYGVSFLEAGKGEEDSVLGLDFFENMAVEYNYSRNSLTLYREVPTGYQALTSLLTNRNVTDHFDGKNDYYVSLDVDGVQNDYRLLSQTGNVGLKLPKDDVPSNSSQLTRIDILDNHGEKKPAEWKSECWIGIGDRLGNFPTCYFDESGWEERCFNPFLLFNQDFVISFTDNTFYVYPHTDAPKRVPMAWQDFTAVKKD